MCRLRCSPPLRTAHSHHTAPYADHAPRCESGRSKRTMGSLAHLMARDNYSSVGGLYVCMLWSFQEILEILLEIRYCLRIAIPSFHVSFQNIPCSEKGDISGIAPSHLETLSSPSLLPRGVRWLRSAWREILLHIEEPGGSSESSGLGGDVMRSDFTPFPAPHIPYLPARVSLVTATASPAFWLRWSCRPP